MEYRTIFSLCVTRRLLKMGNPIVDIRPDKKDSKKMVFIFENTEKLKHDMASATKH